MNLKYLGHFAIPHPYAGGRRLPMGQNEGAVAIDSPLSFSNKNL